MQRSDAVTTTRIDFTAGEIADLIIDRVRREYPDLDGFKDAGVQADFLSLDADEIKLDDVIAYVSVRRRLGREASRCSIQRS